MSNLGDPRQILQEEMKEGEEIKLVEGFLRVISIKKYDYTGIKKI